jgi:flagellar L-ring protein precursor FlgH
MCGSRFIGCLLIAVAVVAAPALANAQAPAPAPAPAAKPSDSYDELFAKYLQEAHASTPVASEQQAWSWMSGITLDRRARNVNDLVTIRVVESIAGTGAADASLSKANNAKAAVTNLAGAEHKLPGWFDPTALAATASKTDFTGKGSTTRTGDLSAVLTARVSDVLPSGDLVVEGIREIEINGDRQIVVLTGVVRATDIGPTNTVLSTSIGQLRIRYFGRGLMKDNLKPGWLIRILNKVF